MENKGQYTKGDINRLIKSLERNLDIGNISAESLSKAYDKGYKRGAQDTLDKLNEKYSEDVKSIGKEE